MPVGQGLPAELLTAVLRGIVSEIQTIRDVLADLEVRMVGTSLLVVYEADWDSARAALERLNAPKAANHPTDEMEDEDADDADENEDEDEDEEEEGRLFAVKLIDFAHTKVTPGLGSDEGLLFGIDTTINLLEGRIKEIEDVRKS